MTSAEDLFWTYEQAVSDYQFAVINYIGFHDRRMLFDRRARRWEKEYNKLEFEGVGFMWFWWFMLICDILIPVVMVIAGRMMWKHCPKHINGMLGYRTTRSMKNMDTWKFAHAYCGKLWWKIGWIMIMPSALIHIPLYHSDKNTIGFAGLILVAIQCFIMIVSIYPTEKALKKYFYNDGRRR